MTRAPLTPEELFARFDGLGIAHRTYEHPPVFTVAEATALRGSLPGGHCKSLFLKDRKGGLWLAVMLEERRIDLKRLADRLGAPRFSTARPRSRRPISCASRRLAATARSSSTSPGSNARRGSPGAGRRRRRSRREE
ncbi:MAG TPA: YbaK/EbsC family protein [Stellaceae bacterium]|nr:YbaK/EbsC family protein [Stellaceae bacterium]